MALISRRDYVASIKQQSPATDSLCTYFKNQCAPANAAINDSVPSTTISMAVDGTIKGSLRMTKPVPDALFRQSHYCYPVFKFGKNHGALLNGGGFPVYRSETLLPSGNIPPTDMARPSSGFRRISGKGALAVYRDAHKDRRLAIFKDVAPKKECHTEWVFTSHSSYLVLVFDDLV